MKFRNWVQAQGGPKTLGRRLRINKFTIYAWLNRGTTPGTRLMQKLVSMGNGAFDYVDIINETKNAFESRKGTGRGKKS